MSVVAAIVGGMMSDLGTELVVLVPARRSVHLLEPDAAVLFDSCRRGHGFDEIVADLAAATGRDTEAVAGWVRDALDELSGRGLLPTAEG